MKLSILLFGGQGKPQPLSSFSTAIASIQQSWDCFHWTSWACKSNGRGHNVNNALSSQKKTQITRSENVHYLSTRTFSAACRTHFLDISRTVVEVELWLSVKNKGAEETPIRISIITKQKGGKYNNVTEQNCKFWNWRATSSTSLQQN